MDITRRQAFTVGAAALAAATIPSGPAPLQAAAPQSGAQAPGFYRFKVGDFEVTALNDGAVSWKVDDTVARGVSASQMQAALEANFLPRDAIQVPFTPLLVNTGSKLVLIDTGFGDSGPPTVGKMAANMAAAGIDPKAVDTVICSHFHGDHISGVRNKAGALIYPNAEIMVPEREWAYWTDAGEESKAPEARKAGFRNVARVFGPIAKDVKPYGGGKELVSGITAIDAWGHTPGHTAFVIASGSGKHLVLSDTTNNPVIFARNPEWKFRGDHEPDEAIVTRRKLLDMAAAERMRVSFYHAAFPATGFIAKDGAGYAYVPSNWSTAL